MRLLFSLTLFCSALLLFLIQPMIGKMILPLLGGTPAVWNTCMVFFQALLLAGYAYAHYSSQMFGARRQSYLHLVLLFIPFLFLPLGLAAGLSPPREANPIPWLLGLLLVTVGMPFFVVSTSAPLLQRWFSATGHSSASNPYFLYGASNLGSMLALLSYPTICEPLLRVAEQSWLWTCVYGLFAALTLACAFTLWRSPEEAFAPAEETIDSDRPPVTRLMHWVALAFVPSSLMLAVTSYLTTDIAAIPLLWVVPLALYLLSFIIVFAGKQRSPRPLTRLLLVLLVLFLSVLMLSKHTNTMGVTTALSLHLGLLFVASLVCHGELAHLRPDPRHLTTFYLAMSLGGVLGGLFNALVAPLLFTSLAEYPITLVLTCMVLPTGRPWRGTRRWLGVALPVTVVLVAAATTFYSDQLLEFASRLGGLLRIQSGYVTAALKYGLPALLCLPLVGRPLALGSAVGGLFLVGSWSGQTQDRPLHASRSFFGVLQVKTGFLDNPSGEPLAYRYLVHGTTVHGSQLVDPWRRREALSYYHRTGPAGQLLQTYCGPGTTGRIAVIGLGVGTLAAYAESGQEWTFYEINPEVIHLARDAGFFTYWQDAVARGARLDVEIGDARLRLADAPAGYYDLLVMDAFSSDAVPVHLLTRDALKIYFEKLTESGLLFVHITNRYVDLEPVLHALALDLGLSGLAYYDRDLAAAPGKATSLWVVLARRETVLEPLVKSGSWRPFQGAPSAVWTDDFSNLFGVFRFHVKSKQETPVE